jgi:hypothetical protein
MIEFHVEKFSEKYRLKPVVHLNTNIRKIQQIALYLNFFNGKI